MMTTYTGHVLTCGILYLSMCAKLLLDHDDIMRWHIAHAHEHVDDVMLHTYMYIHTYIHRYSEFAIIFYVILVFGARSGLP